MGRAKNKLLKRFKVKCSNANCKKHILVRPGEWKRISNNKKRYCSVECRKKGAFKRVKLNCPVCKKSFEKMPSEIRKATKTNPDLKICCSMACSKKLHTKKRFKVPCSFEGCKKVALLTEVRKNRKERTGERTFCSDSCYKKDRYSKYMNLNCFGCGSVFKKSIADYNSELKKNPNKRFCCSVKCTGKLFSKSKIKIPCALQGCTRHSLLTEKQKITKEEKGERFFCSKECYLKDIGFKKNNGICCAEGCDEKATVITKKFRFCNHHHNEHRKQKSEKNALELEIANREAMEIVETLVGSLHYDAFLMNEKYSRQAIHMILHMAGLNKSSKPKNERFLYVSPYSKDGVDLDMVYDELELAVEWKSHWVTCRRYVQYMIDQHEAQLDAIKKSDISNYDLVVASIDGSVGDFNIQSFLVFVKDRIIDFSNKCKLTKVSKAKAVRVLNEFIKKLNQVSHLFKESKIQF